MTAVDTVVPTAVHTKSPGGGVPQVLLLCRVIAAPSSMLFSGLRQRRAAQAKKVYIISRCAAAGICTASFP